MPRIQRIVIAVSAAFLGCFALPARAQFLDTTPAPDASSVSATLPDAPSATIAPRAQDSAGQGSTSMPEWVSGVGDTRGMTSLRSRDKFRLFRQRSFSRSALAGTLLDTAQAQFQRAWPGYGVGANGLWKRFGASLLDRTSNNFFGTFLFPSIFHQDPRYLRLGSDQRLWTRAEYAVSRVIIARDDDGSQSFNASFLLSTAVSKTFENVYYPRQQRGLSPTLHRVRAALLNNIQENLSREFLPDIESFCWRHVPVRIKRLEKHFPFSHRWEAAESLS